MLLDETFRLEMSMTYVYSTSNNVSLDIIFKYLIEKKLSKYLTWSIDICQLKFSTR